MKRAVILITFLMLLVTIVAGTELIAERPTYSTGDYWIFVREDGKEVKIEFLREEKDQYVFNENGTQLIKDFNLTPIKKKDYGGYPGPIIKFPLKAGKWWKYEYEKEKELIEIERIAGKRGKRIATYEVVSYEQTTVPAGTFWVFKIEVTKESKKTISKGSATYWYAPDIKQIIKSSEEGKLSELKEYKINQ